MPLCLAGICSGARGDRRSGRFFGGAADYTPAWEIGWPNVDVASDDQPLGRRAAGRLLYRVGQSPQQAARFLKFRWSVSLA